MIKGEMARYTTSVDSPLTPEAAFAAVADFSTVADWDPGVTAAQRVDAGDLRVGSAFDVDVAMGPGSLRFRYEIVELDAPRLVVLKAVRWPFESVDTITVEPTPTGSRLTYDAVLRLSGPLGLADPLLGLGFRAVGDRAAAGLRRHLDGVAAA